MNTPSKTAAELDVENAELRAQLEEAQETLRAIGAGEVDALVMGEQVYSLKGAETPYRLLVEAMNEAAATLLPDGTLYYCNGRLAERLGRLPGSLIGTSLHSLVTPADLPAFDKLLAEARQGSSQGELNLLCREDQSIPVQISFSVMHEQDGHPLCVVITDLTERKRAEVALQQAHDSLEQRVIERTAELQRERERLSVTLASIGDALIATDAAGRVTILNPVGAALTGWSQQDALGQPVQSVFRVINEKTRAPGEDIVGQVLREGRIVMLANNTALITRDGREIPVEDSAAPIKDSAGKVAGAVLVFRDVTEKRRALKELRDSNAELERFNRLMVGRELRMIELKKEVDELCRRAGQPTRYGYETPPSSAPA
ncbi:MAG: PAS domain S-box protein [Verrucomicrobia bacterium]|nr:PAS domain S-box protein [Verrucomicrobiota bacterium]